MITPSPSYGQERQLQVYTAGHRGQRPTLPVAPEDLEKVANQHLSVQLFDLHLATPILLAPTGVRNGTV